MIGRLMVIASLLQDMARYRLALEIIAQEHHDAARSRRVAATALEAREEDR